jgi:hypothetical protein
MDVIVSIQNDKEFLSLLKELISTKIRYEILLNKIAPKILFYWATRESFESEQYHIFFINLCLEANDEWRELYNKSEEVKGIKSEDLVEIKKSRKLILQKIRYIKIKIANDIYGNFASLEVPVQKSKVNKKLSFENNSEKEKKENESKVDKEEETLDDEKEEAKQDGIIIVENAVQEKMKNTLFKPKQKLDKDIINLYECVPETILVLLSFISQYKNKKVIEPCCGVKKTIVKVLQENGFESVASSDLYYGDVKTNFFDIDFNDFEFIITNPPFLDKSKYIQRCYESKKSFALLLPIETLCYDISKEFYEYGITVRAFVQKPKFIHKEKETTTGYLGWFCYDVETQEKNKIEFVYFQKSEEIELDIMKDLIDDVVDVKIDENQLKGDC